jgi:DNA gyrase/topoisomerase IV subunit B
LGGLRLALTAVGRACGLRVEGRNPLSAAEVASGLTAVVSVHLDRPRFANRVSGRLGNQEVYYGVRRLVVEQLGVLLAEHPDQVHAILRRSLADPSRR